MKENTIKAALAAALGALCAYGIQLLVPVLVLLVVMVLDYITGMAKAWHAGELSSRVGLWGILKKVGYLVIVGVACVVDWLLRYGADSLGWDWPVDFLFASIVNASAAPSAAATKSTRYTMVSLCLRIFFL